MSSIVKAKWVSQITAPVVLPVAHQPETETDNEGHVIHNEEIAENRIDHDESVEAMHAANELMKEAIRASQEIKEKSQETGYQEGFSQGYATGHEEGLQDGTQEGFQAGLKEGLNEGLAQAAAEIENKLREIDEILEQINLERQRALDNQEQELLDIAFEIAKKIMKHQVQEDRDLFLKFFDEVIHGDEENLKIYLSENQKTLDLHINKEMSEKLKKLAKKSKVIILKDEDKIMVETNDSVIDMSLPVQLDQLEKAIEQSS
ncbi:FliH/SctL family protein [Acetobacterium malicum]|uniref:FliH/SctL family protein n=1 Tax=Acetobacterium malicum TaxID=52692 RepID=UPI0004180119|nr:FliH/SctL family protein [Acetobacterium dehalogenans]